eukprot:jgi/Botrbrau1/7272/Bobra.0318s0010.1
MAWKSGLAVTAGITIFLYAGYTMIQHRSMLKLTQEEFTKVPSEVILELAIAAVFCLWGSLGLAGNLEPISALHAQGGLDTYEYRPDFASFNHRGHLLPLVVEPISSH